MRRHKSLGLRGDWGEDALLLEALAVGAASVIGGFEAGAADLQFDQYCELRMFPPVGRTLRRLQ